MDICVTSRIILANSDDAAFVNSMFDRMKTPIDIGDVDESHHAFFRELESVEFADSSEVEARSINATWAFDCKTEALALVQHIGSLSGVNSVHLVSSDGEEPSEVISFDKNNKKLHSKWKSRLIDDWDDLGKLFDDILMPLKNKKTGEI